MNCIIKRNGDRVAFDKEKIYNAIEKANQDVELCGGPTMSYAAICDAVEDILARCWDGIAVEEIQDTVESVLMEYNSSVARSYIRYRYKKEVVRDRKDDFFSAIGKKLNAIDVVNQNANVDEKSFGGRIGEATNEMMKEYALNFCVSDMAKNNHLNNEIYIHDLSHYAVGDHNCLSIPFDDLLAKGFNVRQTDVRAAQSINTAFQLLAVLFQLQSLQQFGGVSATHLDWTMVPYVRKSFYKYFKDGIKYMTNINFEKYEGSFDPAEQSICDFFYKSFGEHVYEYAMDMTVKEVNQAVEGMYHNLNTLQSRSGNQLPFTSINYGTCTLPEGRIVITALLEGSLKGVGKHHRTPIFPCGIFQVGEGINKHPGDPNYDLFQLALKSTSLRLYPNYANIDWSGNAGYDKNDPRTYFSTMGEQMLWLM